MSHSLRELAAQQTPHINPDQSTSYLLATWCPLILKRDNNIIWKNPLPSSIAYARPIALLRAHEDRVVLEGEFRSTFNNLDCEVPVCYGGKEVKVQSHIEISGVDGLMVGLLQGDSGGKCHYCAANRKQCNNILLIMQGFDITKSYAECKKVWDELESGSMKFNNPARGGQMHKPIIGCLFFGVMHKELRSLDFLQHLLYRLHEQVYDWSNSP